MGENQPNLTDPSAAAVESVVNPDNSQEQLIAERVAVAMQVKNPESAAAQDANKVSSQSDGGSSSEVKSEKVSSSANPDDGLLKLLADTTGRTFTSREDAQKYLANLNSLVGDQAIAKNREAARAYESLTAKFAEQSGKSIEDIKQALADAIISGAQKPEPKVEPKDNKEIDRVSSEVEKLREQIQRNELVAKYPGAAEVQDDVAILARQKGVSQLEAFEASPFKSYIEAKAREESAKSPVVTSSSKIGIDASKVKEKVARVLSRGNEEDKVELVKQFGERLGL